MACGWEQLSTASSGPPGELLLLKGLGAEREVRNGPGVCFAKLPYSGFGFGKQWWWLVVVHIELLFYLNPRG